MCPPNNSLWNELRILLNMRYRQASINTLLSKKFSSWTQVPIFHPDFEAVVWKQGISHYLKSAFSLQEKTEFLLFLPQSRLQLLGYQVLWLLQRLAYQIQKCFLFWSQESVYHHNVVLHAALIACADDFLASLLAVPVLFIEFVAFYTGIPPSVKIAPINAVHWPAERLSLTSLFDMILLVSRFLCSLKAINDIGLLL